MARQFEPDWLPTADLVLAADAGHASVRAPVGAYRGATPRRSACCASSTRRRSPRGTLEVDDPWYGDEEDFVRCFTEVEAACRGVATWVTERLRSPAEPAALSRRH